MDEIGEVIRKSANPGDKLNNISLYTDDHERWNFPWIRRVGEGDGLFQISEYQLGEEIRTFWTSGDICTKRYGFEFDSEHITVPLGAHLSQ